MFKGSTSGFGDIKDLLGRLPERVGQSALQAALHEAAEPTAEEARALCPRNDSKWTPQDAPAKSLSAAEQRAMAVNDPRAYKSYVRKVFARVRGNSRTGRKQGHLADNIRVFDVPPQDRAAAVVVSYPRRFFYGHFLEWGTKRMGKIPFLRPAWDATKGEYLTKFGQAMWARLSAALPSGWNAGGGRKAA